MVESRSVTPRPDPLWVLVLLAVVIVYLPSLDHLPRGDQRCILAETNGSAGMLEMVEAVVSYSRSRQIAAGDSLLFRPLFFLQLGVQRLLFEDRFAWWQLTGLALHLLVLWRLHALLVLWIPDRVALGLASLFALAALNVETVTWNHINGYMTFQVFALTAWRHAELAARSPTPEPGRIRLAAGHMLVATFCYEFGAILSAILALRVALAGTAGASNEAAGAPARNASRHLRAGLGLLLVPVLYAALSGLDFAVRSPYIVAPLEGYGSSQKAVLLPAWLSMATAWRFWLDILFTPHQFAYSCVSRIIVWGIEPSRSPWLPGPLTLAAHVGYVLLAFVGFFARPSRSATASPASPSPAASPHGVTWPEAWTPLAALLAYTFLIAAGRLSQRGVIHLTFNLSWAYAFLALAAILVAVLLGSIARHARLFERTTQALAAVGVLFLVLNIPAAWNLNTQYVENQAPTVALLRAVGEWRRAHEEEPGFSFRFRAKPEADTWHGPLPPGHFTVHGVQLDLNSYTEVIHGDVVRPDPAWWLAWEARSDGSGSLVATRAGAPEAVSHGRSPDAPLVSATP